MLEHLYLEKNDIDDEGVAILADALSENCTLKALDLSGNPRITNAG